MPIFRAIFSIGRKAVSGQTYENTNDITYEAIDAKDAVESAMRFIKNRQATDEMTPDLAPYWSPVFALKVYPKSFGPIAEDGSYQTFNGFPVYEWKCDWGVPMGEGGR